MKKEDYYGKYILREGDLRPEEINEGSCIHYGLTLKVLAYLKGIGLIFENKVEALAHWKCIMGAMKKPFNKIEYEQLKKQAIKDLTEGMQETIIKQMEAEQIYKKAFNKILAEKGCVTVEDITKELGLIKTPRLHKRVYISGPISGYPIRERKLAFKAVETYLYFLGYDVINPMENGLPAEATTHEHMQRDIQMLLECDCIYMMSHWAHSKGCMVEMQVASSIGLDFIFDEVDGTTRFK